MIQPRSFQGDDQPHASIYDQCIRCGLCLPSCPTYLETMTETSSPRGRIRLVKEVAEGRLDLLADGFVAQMSECLDCRACEAACPSGVRYGQLLEASRTQIVRAREPDMPAATRVGRSLFVGTLFSRLSLMHAAAVVLRVIQQTKLDRLAGLVGLSRQAALAPKMSPRFFIPRGQRFAAEPSAGLAFLHAGCVMRFGFANVHEATVRMLTLSGLSVVVPAEQGCCGAIAVHAGARADARTMAKRNIEAFERSGADVYVVNAAGCGCTLKEYAALLEGESDWKPRAQRFARRVRDVTEVLDAMDLPAPAREVHASVTYQEPCHLVHGQRVSSAPRRLLERIPGLRLVEMDEATVCCGSAGLYALTNPQMSRRLRDRKIANVTKTDARVVATANPGCAMQLRAGLRDNERSVVVKHVVELLDEAYRIDPLA